MGAHIGSDILCINLVFSSSAPPIFGMAFKSVMKTASSKTTKSKRVSKIARGPFAKAVVLRGGKEKTASGLTKASLMKNKRGKVVSKKANAAGKKAFQNIKDWTSSVIAARKALQFSG